MERGEGGVEVAVSEWPEQKPADRTRNRCCAEPEPPRTRKQSEQEPGGERERAKHNQRGHDK